MRILKKYLYGLIDLIFIIANTKVVDKRIEDALYLLGNEAIPKRGDSGKEGFMEAVRSIKKK